MSPLKNKVNEKIAVYFRYFFILLSLFLVYSLIKNVSRVNKADDRIGEKREKVEKLESENRELKDNLEKVQSGEYVESVLRDGLGYAKEGEIIVVLPDEEVLKQIATKREEEVQVSPKANWVKWLELFL